MEEETYFWCDDTKKHWPRCVALVDMVAFFPSCEQLDFPELRGKPVAVTNGEKGNTIISASYEARSFGIKTGTKIDEALIMCPDLIKRASRPDRYAEISAKIMNNLTNISPDIRVYSIDECFIDLKPVLHLYGSVVKIADMLRKSVFDSSGGLRCSIGISEGQLTAKYCAKKKGKTVIVAPSDIKEYIAHAPITDICGVGKKIEEYLNKYNVYKCKDIEKIPMSVLSKRFGDLGRRLYSTFLGHDLLPVDTVEHDHKSMGHGKVMHGETDRNIIRGVMRQLVERLSRRLRRNLKNCNIFYIGYKTRNGWVDKKYKTYPTNSNDRIWSLVQEHFKTWHKQKIYQLQITAISLEPSDKMQIDLFGNDTTKDNEIDQLKDKINLKLGKSSIRTGLEMLADDQNMIPVIAFNFDAKGKKNSL